MLRSVPCQRNHASWTMSSASAALPSMRYAIPNKRGRTLSNTDTPSSLVIICGESYRHSHSRGSLIHGGSLIVFRRSSGPVKVRCIMTMTSDMVFHYLRSLLFFLGPDCLLLPINENDRHRQRQTIGDPHKPSIRAC